MPPAHPEDTHGLMAQVVIPPMTRFAAARRDVANLVSAIIHPLLFPLVTIIVVGFTIAHSVLGYSVSQSIANTALLAVISVVIASLPVAMVVWVQVKRGKWTDLDVSKRQQRYALYPFTLGCLGLLAYVYYRLGAPNFAVRSVLSILIANVIDGVVNLFWKISAHATTAAACAALLWQILPGSAWGPSAAAGAALVGWSRVELARHTRGQVIAGWFVGASSAVLALNAFR